MSCWLSFSLTGFFQDFMRIWQGLHVKASNQQHADPSQLNAGALTPAQYLPPFLPLSSWDDKML